MSTSHHAETEEVSNPDRLFRGLFAWGIAIGVGFIFGTLNLGNLSIGVVCIIMALIVMLMGMIGGKPAEGFVVGLLVLGLGLLFGWAGGATPNINGSTSFIIGLIAVFAFGWLLFISVNGWLTANKGIAINMMTMGLALIASALLPFALNGLRAFETMGTVGLF